MTKEEQIKGGNSLLAFFLGGVIGATVMLLAAPWSGKEMRGKIRKYSDDAREDAAGYMNKKKSEVVSTIDKGKELFEEKRSAIEGALKAGKEAYLKEKENLKKAS
ncbi:MAG: YtxH domain-containing protein [Nitrospirota bacterium]|nr:MAG: YtxH domain-containing protein [Nitrospirota bacterium]